MAQYFGLTLDQLAPQNGNLTCAEYYNAQGTITLSADEASFMQVLFNQTETATAADFVDVQWEKYATTHATGFTAGTEGTYYIHARFMDDVGNIGAIVTKSTVYDTVAPVISVVTVTSSESSAPAGHTTVANVVVRVNVTDATAGVNYVTLSGDITQSGDAAKFTFTNDDRTAGYKDCNVTLKPITTGQEISGEIKTISAIATDFAGNDSTSVNGQIEYDTAPGAITTTLKNAACTAQLPQYVKELGFGITVDVCPADIVSYKVFDGTKVAGHGSVSEGITTFDITDLVMEDADGLHTIKVELTDDAGNKVEAAHTVNVDRVAPIISEFSFTPNRISDKTGHDTVTFSFAGTDGHFAANVNYQIQVKTAADKFKKVKSGSVASTDSNSKVYANIDVTEAEIVAVKALPAIGYSEDYIFRVVIVDAAGMEGISLESSALGIDTVGPTTTKATTPVYANANPVSSVWTAAEVGLSTVALQYYWVTNSEAVETEVPASASYQAYTDGKINVNLTEGAQYIHVAAADALGNIGNIVVSDKIIYDTTAPELSFNTATGTQTSRSQEASYGVTDTKESIETSGFYKLVVYGDIVDHSTEETGIEVFSPASGTVSFVLTQNVGDIGIKKVYAVAYDNAGNKSTVVERTITLETGDPSIIFQVYNRTHNTQINKTNIKEISLKLNSEDEEADLEGYKLWGDYEGGEATEPTSWTTPYPAEEGEDYFFDIALKSDASEGEKTFYVKVKDVNGNINEATATVMYDTTAATIEVDDVDYNRISKVHQARKDASSAADIAGTYDDMMTFTFTASEDLVEFKVCVNDGAETQSEIEAAEPIFGDTEEPGHSINMTGTASANTKVTCTIMGVDFAAHKVVNDTDGVYEVIVYGKDEAGTWSAGHVIETI